MENLIALVGAMAVCLTLVPLLVRLAPRLGMIDMPGERKIHAAPVPRVGGIGIAAGTIAVVALLMSGEPLVQAYLAGGIALLLLGAWDDSRNIGPYIKFLGQVIAVLPVVLYAGLTVHHFPFLPWSLPEYVGIPFTVFALVGVVNAVNTSDGLDGLAAGESLITLAGVGLLGYLAGGTVGLLIAAAAIGGVLGFLRYNTYPARIFMGDSGSQFLGFTSGVLVVLLTQRTDPGLSPVIVLPLLGLPVADLLMVIFRRLARGAHPMRPDKQHLHHRLLALGMDQRGTVAFIYSIQMVLILAALVLRGAPDGVMLAFYLTAMLVLFVGLSIAERRGWRAAAADRGNRVTAGPDGRAGAVVTAPRLIIETAVPMYIVAVAISVDFVPEPLAVIALGLLLFAALDILLFRMPRSLIHRVAAFLTVAVVVYTHVYVVGVTPLWRPAWEAPFFALLAFAFVLAIRFSPRRRMLEFRTTTTDFLLALMAGASLVLLEAELAPGDSSRFLVYLVVLFYGIELILTERRRRFEGLNISMLCALAAIAIHGLA